MEGTWSNCMPLFEQIYTIHIMPQNGILLPAVYAVLPNKTQETFLVFLTHLVARCVGLGFNLCPLRVQSGFEEGLLMAIRQTWPQTELSCSHLFYLNSLMFRVK